MAQEMPAKKLTASLEDYLKHIYLIESEGKTVRVTDLAAAMHISKASVHKAMKQLGEQGMITHEHYGDIFLTELGKDAAEQVMESYKACYKFLTTALSMDELEADAQADLLEHVLMKSTRKKLKKFTKKLKKC